MVTLHFPKISVFFSELSFVECRRCAAEKHSGITPLIIFVILGRTKEKYPSYAYERVGARPKTCFPSR